MNTISKLKTTKENNDAKLQMEKELVLSAYHLMLLHISSNVMKISLTAQSFRTDTIFILKIPKENNSEKKWWVMVLVLCILFDEAVYLFQFHENID